MNEKFTEAAARLKAGDKPGAQHLLAEILKNDPQNGEAWLWMAAVAPEERRRYCIEKALSIDPANRQAQLALARLDAAPQPARSAPAAPSSSLQSTPIRPAASPAVPPPPQISPAPEPPVRSRPTLTPRSPEEFAIPLAPGASVYPAPHREPEIQPDKPSAWIDPHKNTAMLVFLDNRELITSPVLMGQVKKIQAGLKEGRPPKELLTDPTVIPLPCIQEVSELRGSISVTYTRDDKPHKEHFSFRENAVARTVMDNLEKRLGGGFQRGVRPMGVGARILTILVLLAIIVACTGFFYWGAHDYETGQISPTGGAGTRGIIALVGILGTTGVLIVGGVFVLLWLLNAMAMFARPPQVTVLSRINQAEPN